MLPLSRGGGGSLGLRGVAGGGGGARALAHGGAIARGAEGDARLARQCSGATMLLSALLLLGGVFATAMLAPDVRTAVDDAHAAFVVAAVTEHPRADARGARGSALPRLWGNGGAGDDTDAVIRSAETTNYMSATDAVDADADVHALFGDDNGAWARGGHRAETGDGASGTGSALARARLLASRRERVKDAYRSTFNAYRASAWGYDELKPLSKRGHNWFGLGLTLVDSLDTMLLMNLTDEYALARQWVAQELDIHRPGDGASDASVFEVTIRALGGLLSAFYLSGRDPLYLDKARELGERLLPAFDSASGMPFTDVDLRTGRPHGPVFNAGQTNVAEAGTLTMEWTTLSVLTGDRRFADAAEKAQSMLMSSQHFEGLIEGMWVDIRSGMLGERKITLGARVDSYYEYLLKYWLLGAGSGSHKLGGQDEYLEAFRKAAAAVSKHLSRRSEKEGLLLIGEQNNPGSGRVSNKMDHLVCFWPGLIALGVERGALPREPYLREAKDQVEACYRAFYERSPTGIAPEIIHWAGDGQKCPSSAFVSGDVCYNSNDQHNLLRPETVESLFILHRVTGDERYQEWGWKMFEAFESTSRLESGAFAKVASVSPSNKGGSVLHEDQLDTFWMAETLKYFYLLFADASLLPLDRWVLNTEAHPLLGFGPP